MNLGQLLRTGIDKARPNGVYKAYDKPGGTAVAVFKQQTLVGRFSGEVNTGWFGLGDAYWGVQLLAPVVYQNRSYTIVYVEAGKLFAVSESALSPVQSPATPATEEVATSGLGVFWSRYRQTILWVMLALGVLMLGLVLGSARRHSSKRKEWKREQF